LNSSYEYEHGGSLKGKIYRALDLWTNWKTDRYVAVSKAIRSDLLTAGIPESAVDLIHNSVEVDESAPSEDRHALRTRLGIPQDAFMCVLVGRLVWAKGYDDFIRAFSAVADRLPKIYAVIAGDGELFEALSNQVKQAGLEQRVLLLGFCNRASIFNLLKAGDVYVMPSRSEGIPFALLEAAALGLPIVATNCGGIPEVVTNQEDAILVPVGDAQALSSALARLDADRKLAEGLARKARERIKNHFAPTVQVELVREAYRNALSHRISQN
jgi:glycosyltransferase involved in cell wall biosynthesis